MSKPDNAETQVPENKTSEAPEQQTFEQQVNTAASKMTQGEDGNWALPEGLTVSPEVQYAATLEKRRRDTESAFGKTRHQLKVEEETRKQLEQRVADQIQLTLTPEQQTDLEQLKFDDPDAWRAKMNQYESEATTAVREELSTISTEASQRAELDRRAQVLEQFNASATVQITDEVLESDIPPRLTKQLTNNEITFEEFLDKAHDYLVKPRKVAEQKLNAQPNLGNAGGSAEPSGEAQKMGYSEAYGKQSF